MKSLVKIFAVVLMVSLLAAPAFAELKFGGYVRTNYQLKLTTDEAKVGDDTKKTIIETKAQAGLDVESSMSSDTGLEASAKGTFTLKGTGVTTDDIWVQLKKDTMAVKIGRFEATGLGDKGADFGLVTPNGFPGWVDTNKARGRKDLGAMLTMDGEAMDIEINTVLGSDGGNNFYGARPVIKFSGESFSAKAGAEYYLEKPQDNDAKGSTSKYGAGGCAEFNLGSITLGGTVGYTVAGGKTAADKDKDDVKNLMIFGYMKMAVGENGTLGLGGGYAKQKVEDDDGNSGMAGYVSYKIKPFLGMNDLRLEVGVSYGRADIEATDTTNSIIGVRSRLRYDWGGTAS
jgi:hypothetical protein